ATVVSAFICGCASIFSCVWGVVIVSGQPIDVTSNGATTPEVLSPTIGYVLLCLTVLMITIPVAVGFFTFRKKNDEEQSVNIID
ncbi:MAG TPA: hypothetical protein VLA72_14860, partial [Anaerolineales bacterium]|nr:hypothetical protein [Anaerolineales bacterium]